MEFSEFWNVSYLEPLNPLTAEQAHARHETGETYTVLVPDATKPRVAIEVTLRVGVVKVRFLDDRLREVRSYVFTDEDRGRLFLQQSRGRTYTDDDEYGRNPTYVDNVITRTSGLINVRQGQPKGAMTESEGTMSPDDMAVLWEPLPDWGDWSGYGRLDRDRPNPDPEPFTL